MSEKMRFYVATDGQDNWSGTLAVPNESKTDGPFATLAGARDAIRKLKLKLSLSQGGITVFVRGGVYSLEDTFSLTPEDSGTETSPIVYQAFNGEEVRITGGKEISGFKPVTDTSFAVIRR